MRAACAACVTSRGVVFDGADFRWARSSGGAVYFAAAQFSGPGLTFFEGAQFSGAWIFFSGARFSGGTVDFSSVGDWSFPPAFPWTDMPPAVRKLPEKRASQS